MSQDAYNGKRHSSKVAECIAGEHSSRIPELMVSVKQFQQKGCTRASPIMV